MSRPGRAVGALALIGVLLLGYGLVRHGSGSGSGGGSGGSGGSGMAGPAPAGTGVGARPVPADPLVAEIARLQAKLRGAPGDYALWGQLGLDYVQQAKITVDPTFYPKAAGALDRSLQLNTAENFSAMAGEAALTAAEHKFSESKGWAERGLAIDPYNATLYGSLNDADTQLGLYDQAQAAAQKMLDLKPGVASFTRGEYVLELRGDLAGATAVMRRALQAAQQARVPADEAFVDYYLGELAFSQGDAATALTYANAGLSADPTYSALREGRAKAEAALGQVDAAVADYLRVVSEVPQPTYLIEAGEYLQSLGRLKDAQAQYALFDTENALFTANGVTLDTDPTLFYADHGNPVRAMGYAEAGLKIRPFVEMQDAYGWALHANGRDAQALTYARQAIARGTRNALFLFHRGMIEKALGQRTAAVSDLTAALAMNPHFNPLRAPVLRTALSELGSAG